MAGSSAKTIISEDVDYYEPQPDELSHLPYSAYKNRIIVIN